MNNSSNEAQRELEQRALRNVRNLVDKIDATEEADARTQRRVLVAIVVGALLVAGAIALVLAYSEKPKPVVIEPAKLPPIAPGPPK
jgi:hypothetical protein